MATFNIDCPLSDRICSLQQLNLNVFNSSDIPDCNDSEPCLRMPSNISSASLRESESIEEFTNQLLNECSQQPSVDGNKNCQTIQCSKPIDEDCYSAAVDDNKNPLSPNKFKKHDSFAIFQAQNVIPEELFINVESDDEGVHSWRPNMSFNALCSDVFVCEDMNLNFRMPLQNKTETGGSSSQWSSELPNLPLMLSSNVPSVQQPNKDVSYSKMDKSGLLRAQVAGLNNVKYETINARRRIAQLTDEIQKLTQKLNEKLIVQRTLDVEKLREENSQLRLECQCLCMEVDYYLKGNTPLGEIDETFYQGDSGSQRNPSASQNQAEASTVSDSSDDVEDCMKWECKVCTFANHPAINFCEMCQTSRSLKNSSDANDTCFCHPRGDTS